MENFIISVVPRCAVSLYHKIINILRIAKIKHHHWILPDSTSKAMFSIEKLIFIKPNMAIFQLFEEGQENQRSDPKSN